MRLVNTNKLNWKTDILVPKVCWPCWFWWQHSHCFLPVHILQMLCGHLVLPKAHHPFLRRQWSQAGDKVRSTSHSSLHWAIGKLEGLVFIVYPSPQIKNKVLKGWAWWQMAVIPATREAETRGSQSKASLGKSSRFQLKNKWKAKGLEAWFKW
jgi:hypothetical protein